MALHSSRTGCERDCREIHAIWEQLNHLGQALAHRTPAERRQIRETYKALYGEDLVQRLHNTHMANNTGNEKLKMLYLWMMEPHERDAVLAHEALESNSCCESSDYIKAVVELYTRRKSSQLFLTKQAYVSRFNRHLDQDIISQPSHPFQRMLVALGTSHRSHHTETSRHVANCDAKRLYEAGSRGGAIDEGAILEMFSKRSIPQLRLAFTTYKHIYGHNYTKTLKKESSGEFEHCLRVVVNCMHHPSKYYSRMLYKSLKGPRTGTMNPNVLSRVMMGSAEVGMEEVKAAFQHKYQMSVQEAIYQNLAAGEYRDFLIALANAPASTA